MSWGEIKKNYQNWLVNDICLYLEKIKPLHEEMNAE